MAGLLLMTCWLAVRPETYTVVLRVCSRNERDLMRMPASFEHACAIVIEHAKHAPLRPVGVNVHDCRSIVKGCTEQPP